MSILLIFCILLLQTINSFVKTRVRRLYLLSRLLATVDTLSLLGEIMNTVRLWTQCDYEQSSETFSSSEMRGFYLSRLQKRATLSHIASGRIWARPLHDTGYEEAIRQFWIKVWPGSYSRQAWCKSLNAWHIMCIFTKVSWKYPYLREGRALAQST